MGENTQVQWRTELWRRCDRLGPAVRRKASRKTQLTDDQVQEAWDELLAKLAAPIGSASAAPAAADSWTDRHLKGFLDEALGNAIGKIVRKEMQQHSGETYIAATPIEEFGDEVRERGTIWRNVIPPTPEQAVHGGDQLSRIAHELHELAGPDAARLVFDEVAGGEAAKGLTRGRRRTLEGRVEKSRVTLMARMQAVSVWLLPDWLFRWVFATGGGSTIPRVGVTIVAAGSLIAGGTTVAVKSEGEPVRKIAPPLSSASSSATQSSAPVTTQLATSTQAAANTIRERERARNARAAAKRRAAAAKRAKEKARASAAAQEFGNGAASSSESTAAAAAPAPRSAPTAPSGGLSPAAEEFTPSGR